MLEQLDWQRRLRKVPSRSLFFYVPVGGLLLAYVLAAWGLWLGASWLVGRFFAPAHLGFIITVFSLAYLIKLSPTETNSVVKISWHV